MAWYLGVDEAGYGPNLGPLVVTVTVWQTDAGPDVSLYQVLRKVVASAAHESRLVVADSKQLYSTQRGLQLLEENVLALLANVCDAPSSPGRHAPPCRQLKQYCNFQQWRDLWQLASDDDRRQLEADPCYAGFDCPLPVAADAQRIATQAETARRGFAAAGVRLVSVRSRVVLPLAWNGLLKQHGSKGVALSTVALELLLGAIGEPSAVSEPAAVANPGNGSIYAMCDKHGGRNRYLELLQPLVGDPLVEVHAEGAEASVYRWGPAERRVEVRFEPRGERHLPTALASMVSKYLRELAMKAFNEFWITRCDGLRPTAGYSVDAQRWIAEVEAARKLSGIEHEQLWRQK